MDDLRKFKHSTAPDRCWVVIICAKTNQLNTNRITSRFTWVFLPLAVPLSLLTSSKKVLSFTDDHQRVCGKEMLYM